MKNSSESAFQGLSRAAKKAELSMQAFVRACGDIKPESIKYRSIKRFTIKSVGVVNDIGQ